MADEETGPRMRCDGAILEALSTDERIALARSATGLDATGVAEILCRTPHDVRQSLTSAMRKLGAMSKLEAIVIALRIGLIDLPGATRPPDSEIRQ